MITATNYHKTKYDMITFLHKEINRYIERWGSREKLSLALGYSENHIRLAQSRDKWTIITLEKLWRECEELELKEDIKKKNAERKQ